MIIKKLTITITKMILITRLSLQGITTHWLVPNYAAWWQRHVLTTCPGLHSIVEKPRFKLATYWSQVQRSKNFGVCEATKPHTQTRRMFTCCKQPHSSISDYLHWQLNAENTKQFLTSCTLLCESVLLLLLLLFAVTHAPFHVSSAEAYSWPSARGRRDREVN